MELNVTSSLFLEHKQCKIAKFSSRALPAPARATALDPIRGPRAARSASQHTLPDFFPKLGLCKWWPSWWLHRYIGLWSFPRAPRCTVSTTELSTEAERPALEGETTLASKLMR